MSFPEESTMKISNDTGAYNRCVDDLTLTTLSASSKDLKATSTRKRMTIQRDRQATLFNRATMEMNRTTRLAMTSGETHGSLTFVVPKHKALVLQTSANAIRIRASLYRHFEYLHPSRKEDDSAYLDAVRKGMSVKLIKALPADYDRGGWRCHALVGEKECLHPNRAHDKHCSKCETIKSNLKPEFAYLRLLLPGMRQQRGEYIRMIKECDSELCRCEIAEQEANEKIADFEERLDKGFVQTEDEEVELSMDVDLIQTGVWQRGNARSLLPMLFDRKNALNTRLQSARAEVAIMIQCTYDLAVIHVQKIVRRYLARCRLSCRRQAKETFARYCASLEIQRLARGKLAKILFVRLLQHRDCFMATKIQSIFRMRKAVLERKRLFDIHWLQLQHQKAIVIQSFVRMHAAKRKRNQLDDLRKLSLEEQERNRIATIERNAATLIQSAYRRYVDKIKCKNRRIEMNLHCRLLMYLERFAIDGDMWKLMKSINDDYLRFERTIKHVIQREEKMAKTFVERVVRARDEDHSSAWNKYHTLKDDSRFNTRSSTQFDEKSIHCDFFQGNDARSGVCVNRQNSVELIYKNALSDERNRAKNKSKDSSIGSRQGRGEGGNTVKKQDCNLYRREAKQLSMLEQANARLRGQYIRFDIPNGLDDTLARFVKTVAMHYNSNLQFYLEEDVARSSARQAQKKGLDDGDELIHALHEKGYVFIRQLLPIQRMRLILHEMKVDQDFILLAHALVIMLQKMDGGKYLERSYLVAKCNSFLDMQCKMGTLTGAGGTETNANLDIVDFLGQCGAAGCGERFDEDIPSGLFETQNATVESIPFSTLTNKMRNRSSSWASKLSQKIISDNETAHPAYQGYRRGQLLSSFI